MENDKTEKSGSKTQVTNDDFNSHNRDFQRTGDNIDGVSKSEKEELQRRKQRIHKASTKPDKNHVG